MTLLSRDEVVRLTGRKQRRRQVEQLARVGIPFVLDADGWPVVASDAIDRRGKPNMERLVIEALRATSPV
jgi:hypothetical protein